MAPVPFMRQVRVGLGCIQPWPTLWVLHARGWGGPPCSCIYTYRVCTCTGSQPLILNEEGMLSPPSWSNDRLTMEAWDRRICILNRPLGWREMLKPLHPPQHQICFPTPIFAATTKKQWVFRMQGQMNLLWEKDQDTALGAGHSWLWIIQASQE